MKKKIFAFMFLLLFNVATAETIFTNKNNVPLQISSTSTQVLALIPNGTRLETEGANGTFYTVTYNGVKGCVYNGNVSGVSSGTSSKEPVISSKYSTSQAMLTKAPMANSFVEDTLYIDGAPKVKCLIYTPYNISGNLPLVVYLHGVGESGTDINVLKNSNSLPKYLANGQLSINSIVVMPQATSESGFVEGSESGEYLKCLINEMVETYNVDRNRISMVGFSMGAKRVCYTAGLNSNTFSSAVIISGYKGSVEDILVGLSRIPVRGYWGTEDSSSNSPKGTINSLRNRGGNAEFYEIPGANHGQTPAKVFLEHRVLDWMILQSK